jgi:hypothetical protein
MWPGHTSTIKLTSVKGTDRRELVMLRRTVFGLDAEFTIGALWQIAELRRAWRGRMRVVFGRERAAKPTICFLTPDFEEPSGGIRVIYRHMSIYWILRIWTH